MSLINFILSTCLGGLALHCNAHRVKYAVRQESKLPPDLVTGHLPAVTKLECAGSCSSREDCRAMSWDQRSGQCLLSDEDLGLDWEIGYAAGYSDKLLPASTWVTYSEIRYPVARFYRGHYSFSLNGARKVCKDHGLELATEEQVLAARAMGLHRCACGWFENGRMGFVLQSPFEGCISYFHSGILHCTNRDAADAWCAM